MSRPTSLNQVKWECEKRHSGYVFVASWFDPEGTEWHVGDSFSFAYLNEMRFPDHFLWMKIHRMTCSLLTKSQLKKYPRFPFPDASGV